MFFNLLYLFNFTSMCVLLPCMSDAHRREGASDPLQQDVGMIVYHSVNVGNEIHVFYEKSK